MITNIYVISCTVKKKNDEIIMTKAAFLLVKSQKLILLYNQFDFPQTY